MYVRTLLLWSFSISFSDCKPLHTHFLEFPRPSPFSTFHSFPKKRTKIQIDKEKYIHKEKDIRQRERESEKNPAVKTHTTKGISPPTSSLHLSEAEALHRR